MDWIAAKAGYFWTGGPFELAGQLRRLGVSNPGTLRKRLIIQETHELTLRQSILRGVQCSQARNAPIYVGLRKGPESHHSFLFCQIKVSSPLHPAHMLPRKIYFSPPGVQIKSILSSYCDFPRGYYLHIIFTLVSYFLLTLNGNSPSWAAGTRACQRIGRLQGPNRESSRTCWHIENLLSAY